MNIDDWKADKSIFSAEHPVLITGASGQVGRALAALYGTRALALPREEFDLSAPEKLPTILERYAPAAIINSAAYTQVDLAETDEEAARKVNGIAPGILARWCAERHVPFVHFSTDYVFSGEGTNAWRENDLTSPINAYGRTKLIGEQEIAASGALWLIFRTSWVYDAEGKNFVRTMLRLGKEREVLSVVNDQFGAPTYAPHLALATAIALEKAMQMPSFPTGIYHLCNHGITTWHEFAEAVFSMARANGMPLQVRQVNGISSDQYPTPARRPRNSRLSMDKMERTFGLQMPRWEQGLAECLERLRKSI